MNATRDEVMTALDAAMKRGGYVLDDLDSLDMVELQMDVEGALNAAMPTITVWPPYGSRDDMIDALMGDEIAEGLSEK